MKRLIIISMLVVLAGCQSKEQQEEAPQQETTSKMVEPTTVDTNPQQAFTTLGKVVAIRYADLSFQSTLPIMQVYVKNGQQVRQGQRIAELDMFRLNNTIEQQKRQMEQAELQMQDVIISQGYDPDKPSSVPNEVRRTAEVKSGYQVIKEQLAAAEHELQTAMLSAPFDGIVANVKAQAHEISKPGEPVCRIVSTKDMAVEFRVMETDLGKYSIGTKVIVIPSAYKDRQYEAVVSEVNPIVDQQGAITLRAKLSDVQDLFDGMNVEIIRN